jgi:ABC-type bacteriocin/lantibiotic exporter with double-glycine peptidase domain
MKLAADLRDCDDGSMNLLLEKSTAPSLIINHVNRIKLENVSYTYPTTVSPALDKISIEIEAGEHIGIVGSSGAGKTTLVDTLLGLLPPSEGRILINGQNITEHPEALWQHVAYLPQDIFIIDGSVQQNIALGVPDEEIDYDQLTYAISQAQMRDVISNLPNGLKTSLGENGVNLSGGQRQRIALARAFYFKRQILVLDEATSSLDVKAETQVINYLKSLKNKITVISITHRANSLEHCNRILTIAQGRITS